MKKCNKCGKMFNNKDKRVKRCDSCRFGEDNEKKMQEFAKDLRESTERLQKAIKRVHRKLLIKKIVIISILVAIEVVNLVLIFVK